jgi:hypothetical protein
VAVETAISPSSAVKPRHESPTFSQHPAPRDALAASLITLACLEQPRFHEQATAIRLSRRTADQVATLYSKRGSAGHFVMEYILAAAARAEAEDMWPVLTMLLTREQRSERPAGRNMPGEAALARWKRGAALIARRGSGLCLVPGCDVERGRATVWSGPRAGSTGQEWQYCDQHYSRRGNKRDARIIEDTFAVAESVIRWSFRFVGPRLD